MGGVLIQIGYRDAGTGITALKYLSRYLSRDVISVFLIKASEIK